MALDPDAVPALYSLQGGEPAPVPGLRADDVPLCWTPDGRELLVARYEDTPPRIERIEVATGRARPWNGPRHSLPSGLFGQSRILVSPDGESYAYGIMREMSDLYLSSPLR